MRLSAFKLFFAYWAIFVTADIAHDLKRRLLSETCKERGKNINKFKNNQFGQESCEHPYLRHFSSVSSHLRQSLKTEFIGQHIAQDLILFSISAHLDDPKPYKALVLSLHGFPEAEKYQISETIADSIYSRGLESKYVGFFTGPWLHFPEDGDSVWKFLYRIRNMIQQFLLRTCVQEVSSDCYRSLLIFDVDKEPSEILDGIADLIYHPDFNRHIFIFLTSVGSKEIRDIAYRHWKDGKERKSLSFKDFRMTLNHIAYNTSRSGLHKSLLVEKSLIDWYVPFLPLDKQLIISCIQLEARKIGMAEAEIKKEAETIADMIYYWPEDERVFATTSCKQVETLVKLRNSEVALRRNEQHYDEDSGTNCDYCEDTKINED